MKIYIVRKERKYVVRRAICLTVLCVMIALISIGLKELITYSVSSSNRLIAANKSLCEYPVTIQKGETAWGIQSALISDSYDIRQVLFEVEKINGKKVGYLKEGDTITFLKEKK